MLRAITRRSPLDEELTHVSKALQIIIWTLMAASLMLALSGLLAPPQYMARWLRIFVTIQALSVPTLILNRWGFTRLASMILVVWLWILVTGVVFTGGGLASLASFVYVIIVFIAGFLLGPKAGIVAALLCIFTALGFVLIEMTGRLPSTALPYSSIARWISLMLFIVIMMSLQYLSARTIRDALVQTKRELQERKRAEESLRLSEERFAKAFQASPEPIAIFRHHDSLFLEVNDRWTSVYGYTREEVVGHAPRELNQMSSEDHERLRALLDKQRSIRECEVDIKTKQGETRHISLAAEQIVINDELCDIFLHRDITERRRGREENRKLIHDLGERVKELTALHQTASVLQQESAEVSAILREIALLLPVAFQYPEITAARVRLGENEWATPGFSSKLPILRADFKTADQQAGSIEVVYTEERAPEFEGPYLKEERALINTLAEMLRTDYNRRESERALRESEQRFRQLTDNLREVLWLYTPDYTKVLYISPAYETVWGRTRESLDSNPLSFLDSVHANDRARVEETIRQAEHGFDLEYRVLANEGSVRWIWARGFPIKDSAGQVYRIAGIAEDITERKEVAEKLKASSEQLRALSVSLRTAKEEEGIRIARELHDELGSALTTLKWSLLRLDKVRSSTSKSAGKAAEKIAEMVELVDSTINTVRRISSELRPGVVDDLGLVSAIEWHAQQFQDNTGVVCRFESSAEDVDLNREQATTVFRIFQEAMTNILRHAQATKANILIEEEEDGFVLEIKDNGRGITETEKLGIRSLGLLGMRERAHSVGGTVEISGAAGRGTVLTVHLPIQKISDFKSGAGDN